jgi:hypothetical protein
MISGLFELSVADADFFGSAGSCDGMIYFSLATISCAQLVSARYFSQRPQKDIFQR